MSYSDRDIVVFIGGVLVGIILTQIVMFLV